MNVISTNEPLNSMDSYQIVELIKYLQNSSEVSDKDLFNVEWAYLSLLDSNENASPEYLANRLASDPEFFCEAIQLLYRSKKDIEKERETGEEEKAIAENLWPLLHSSKKAPGIQSDGNFSIDCFSKWFDKVKELCLESDHLEIALEHVGQVLVYCPPDPDGLWIDKGIANELNAADAEHMRIGFRLEIFNSRGFIG